MVAAQRHAGALAAEGEELGRARVRPPVLADLRYAPTDLSFGARAARCPDRSPLMSAAKTGTPAAESCSAITCSVLVLPVPVAPGDEPVPVQHAQWDADNRCWDRRVALHQHAEVDSWLVEGVAGNDSLHVFGELIGAGARSWAKS